ncbi:MAG: hypothetical protein UY56_C0008G0012 [Parcubacteria group bacterium GW2011_GWA1_50_14]|uniref:Translation elongation factor-like protein n=1 Tax=Candidatus Liptonbacteria bacterium GWB1_49_6 TaxID=1798644 RepID=A0A1G2C7T7_9BACT|nr:MAG: hypothetical protein UY56_C0008G0012 [Parcubacteria group bacterium GW2011_GWA1_50_14]OGY96557.1 MAG: hypothetical protein A2122_02510 [Candidatus Liptonbacteria bacterium GWB1_49_6]
MAGDSPVKRSPARKGNAKLVLLGAVTHYFGHIGVAIVKCKKPISVGDALWFKGATTDFRASVSSMQWEHKPISKSKKGQEVGIKVKEHVREGDSVFPA